MTLQRKIIVGYNRVEYYFQNVNYYIVSWTHMSLTLGSTSPPLASQPDWQQPRGLRPYHLTIIPYYDAARRRRSSFNYQFVSMYINDNINRKDTSNSFNYRNKCSLNLRVGPAVMARVTRPSPSVRCSYRKTQISMIGLHQQK